MSPRARKCLPLDTKCFIYIPIPPADHSDAGQAGHPFRHHFQQMISEVESNGLQSVDQNLDRLMQIVLEVVLCRSTYNPSGSAFQILQY